MVKLTVHSPNYAHLIVTQRSVPLDKLVGALDASIRSEADRKGLKFTCTLDPSMPERIVTDPDALSEIAVQLLRNAVTFTNSGSITLAFRNRGPSFLLEVTDTGIGIPAFAAANVLFGRRLNGDLTAGSGLPKVRRLISALGGHLMMMSEPNLGSTFSVVLPLIDADDTQPLRP